MSNDDEGEFWFGQLALGRSFSGQLEVGQPISFHFHVVKRFITNLYPYEELNLERCRPLPPIIEDFTVGSPTKFFASLHLQPRMPPKLTFSAMEIKSPAPTFVGMPTQSRTLDDSASDNSDDFVIDETLLPANCPPPVIIKLDDIIEETIALENIELESIIDKFIAPELKADFDDVKSRVTNAESAVETQVGQPQDVEPQNGESKSKCTILSDECIVLASPPNTLEDSYEEYEYLEEATQATVAVSPLAPPPTPAQDPSNTSRKVNSSSSFLMQNINSFLSLFLLHRAANIADKREKSCLQNLLSHHRHSQRSD